MKTIPTDRNARHAAELYDELDSRGTIVDQRDLHLIHAAFRRHAREILRDVQEALCRPPHILN